MKEAVPAQRFQWSVLAVITEGITLKLEKKEKNLNKTNLCSFFIVLLKKKMSAINILTAKQSLFLNIITVFFGTSGNLLVGARRKEKLCLSKRLCSSQNLFFTQISCKTEAEQPVLNKLTSHHV